MNLVGKYKDNFNYILDIDLPIVDIYESDGLIKHINKRHPGYEKYICDIPKIIENPDYIGTNKNEPNSIELIKVYPEDNIQVAVKLDISKNYLYVASLYDISEYKLHSRIKSGRLKKY